MCGSTTASTWQEGEARPWGGGEASVFTATTRVMRGKEVRCVKAHPASRARTIHPIDAFYLRRREIAEDGRRQSKMATTDGQDDGGGGAPSIPRRDAHWT